MCQCCKQADWVNNTISSYRGNKYLLCKSCIEHLKARALSPREWYNLIVTHGQYAEYINNNYYYTNGVSILPKITREFRTEEKLPSLIEVKNDLSQLMEYCFFPFSRENLAEKISALIELATKESKLGEIIKNEKLLSHILESAPKFNEKFFNYTENRAWIESHWENNQNLSQAALIKTSLAYMEVEEVLALVTDKITHHQWDASVMVHFPLSIAMDWIEKNAHLSAN
jgi:hypothetical protein